jgi:isoquinoline 1-oxidoreductase subunit beta
MTGGSPLSRRSFLAGVSAAGGGLTLALAIPFGPASAAADGAEAPEVTAWLTIQPDNSVVIRIARAEMGQGAQTGLAMLVAEELECDWAKVSTEFISAGENLRRHRIWGDTSTGASRSIGSSQLYLRQAGATAREMLIAAAAARWGVPPSQCVARMSAITHKPSGRTTTFAAVAADAAKITVGDIPLKDPASWKLAGTPRRRLDVLDKATARPVYAIDVRLPGMLYAAIKQCPIFGGTPKSVDESAIAGMKGVRRVVRMADSVAVVADSWWRAKRALDALPIVWDERGNGSVSSASIAELVRAALDADDAQVGQSDGDINAGLERAAQRVVAEYTVPYLAHATMEPQNCTAHVRPGQVEVWAPSQGSTTALVTAAVAAGVPNDQVTVHTMMLGGGFGRRGAIQEYIRQAVLIAKEVDAPVKLVWTREEDMRHDFYRPFGMARLTAGLDVDGMPTALKIRLAGPSFVATFVSAFGANIIDRTFLSGLIEQEMAYDVPNYHVDYLIRQTPVPVGVWRAINYSENAFYKECFIDELAHAAGMDPYLYRRRLLRNSPKNLAVLDAAARKADWFSPPPRGVSRGIAVMEACGSYCAHVVEVSVERGSLHVHRVVSALDPGHVVNPLSIEMQTQGAIIYALTAALYGEITIKDGTAEQGNFDTYEMLRMADAPKVETVIVPSGGFWGGVGEPPVPPLAPALCNAVFAATGKRIRTLPLKNHDLTRAI